MGAEKNEWKMIQPAKCILEKEQHKKKSCFCATIEMLKIVGCFNGAGLTLPMRYSYQSSGKDRGDAFESESEKMNKYTSVNGNGPSFDEKYDPACLHYLPTKVYSEKSPQMDCLTKSSKINEHS